LRTADCWIFDGVWVQGNTNFIKTHGEGFWIRKFPEASGHEDGIVHRDLKPENVIRTESGIVKILDFGLARVEPKEGAAANPRLTQSGVFLGTPAYASPEQLLASAVDGNTDIFSFGIILYEMASGKHPFKAADSMSVMARSLEAEVPMFPEQNLPGDFVLIVLRCLKKRPSERYASTQDLLAERENLLSASWPPNSLRRRAAWQPDPIG
jgi:eukaryotic-like serine/threonine-protein kinase